LYVTIAALMVRSDETADASFADMRARIKFGIAIAARVKMTLTTINNSMSEKPFDLRTRTSSASAFGIAAVHRVSPCDRNSSQLEDHFQGELTA
jgi:hypothetical protein